MARTQKQRQVKLEWAMGEVAQPLSTNKGLKTIQAERHDHVTIIHPNLSEELLEEEQRVKQMRLDLVKSMLIFKVRLYEH